MEHAQLLPDSVSHLMHISHFKLDRNISKYSCESCEWYELVQPLCPAKSALIQRGGFNSAITASETGANWQLAVQLMSCMPMMRLTSSVIRFLSRFIRLEWCIYFGVLCQLWNLWEGRLFVIIWKHVKMCEDLWRLESWGLQMSRPHLRWWDFLRVCWEHFIILWFYDLRSQRGHQCLWSW